MIWSAWSDYGDRILMPSLNAASIVYDFEPELMNDNSSSERQFSKTSASIWQFEYTHNRSFSEKLNYT